MLRTSAVAMLACAAVAGCSAGRPGATPTPSGTGAGAPGATSGAWWQSGADYCALLRDTLQAGDSVFAGAAAPDPDVRRATSEFLAALQRAAPAPVASEWRLVGGAVEQLMSPAYRPAEAVGAVAVRRATAVIAADARRRCGLSARALG